VLLLAPLVRRAHATGRVTESASLLVGHFPRLTVRTAQTTLQPLPPKPIVRIVSASGEAPCDMHGTSPSNSRNGPRAASVTY
jgi:hypothetical protein